MAKIHASNLARRLGPGWKSRVWENLGWHWEAVNGGWKCGKRGVGKFYAYFDDEFSSCESTPKKAVAAVLKTMEAKVEHATAQLKRARTVAR